MSKWAEIRCDYCDDDGFWSVDAWRTDNGNEMGNVIAYIDSLTGRVIYTEPLARVDEYAQEVIKEALANKDIVTGIWALVTYMPDGGASCTLYNGEDKAEEGLMRGLEHFAKEVSKTFEDEEDSEPLHIPKMESAEAFKAYVKNNFPATYNVFIENPHLILASFEDTYIGWKIIRMNVNR